MKIWRNNSLCNCFVKPLFKSVAIAERRNCYFLFVHDLDEVQQDLVCINTLVMKVFFNNSFERFNKKFDYQKSVFFMNSSHNLKIISLYA